MSGISSPKLTNSGASTLSALRASRRVKKTRATPIPTVEIGTFTIPLKSAPFLEAEQILGASFPRIVVHHVLPNILGPLVILASMDIPVVITIEVDFDGTILWNGEQVDRPTLDAKFQSAAALPVQPEFHLRPNKLVTYKHVAHVMAAAQRDGITKIGLIGAEQFLD